jgi:hypothetical protein
LEKSPGEGDEVGRPEPLRYSWLASDQVAPFTLDGARWESVTQCCEAGRERCAAPCPALRAKFEQHADLLAALLATGDEQLPDDPGAGPGRSGELLARLRAEYAARGERRPSLLDELIAIVTQLGP